MYVVVYKALTLHLTALWKSFEIRERNVYLDTREETLISTLQAGSMRPLGKLTEETLCLILS